MGKGRERMAPGAGGVGGSRRIQGAGGAGGGVDDYDDDVARWSKIINSERRSGAMANIRPRLNGGIRTTTTNKDDVLFPWTGIKDRLDSCARCHRGWPHAGMFARTPVALLSDLHPSAGFSSATVRRTSPCSVRW